MKKIAPLFSIIFILSVLCMPVIGYAQSGTGSETKLLTEEQAKPLLAKPTDQLTTTELDALDKYMLSKGAPSYRDQIGMENYTPTVNPPVTLEELQQKNTQLIQKVQDGLNGKNAGIPGITPQNISENGCTTYDSRAVCYQQLAPIDDPANPGKKIDTSSFSSYLQAIYRIGIGACFMLGVIMFTWAGIEYIVSESMNTKSDAKKRIAASLTGLAIALVSFILLQTINPKLLIIPDLNTAVSPKK